jgi:outer membrane protein TolC
MTRALLAMGAALWLCACGSVPPAPSQAPDESQVSSLPSSKDAPGLQAGTPTALWWRQWGDAHLDDLVQRAWQANHDIRIATARLASTREQLRATEGAAWPDVALDAGAGRARLAAVESRSGAPAIVNPVQWQALLGWELDLFGRVRKSIEAAQAASDEQAALRDDVRRLIVADVVSVYLDLRGVQALHRCLREQLANQDITLQLVRDREEAGRTPPAERMRFEAQMRLVNSRLPSLIAQERALRNRLATLTGQRLDSPQLAALESPTAGQDGAGAPDAVHTTGSTPEIESGSGVALALPAVLLTDESARLLLRRPDVRAAERALAGAMAREGMAHADLFPRISLAALLGSAGTADDWTGADARRWRVGGALSWSLFDGGARRAQWRAAGAEVEGARAHFEKVMALALEETDSAIAAWVQLRQRHAELKVAYELAQESSRLARIRYQEGAESLLGVLEAERIALSAHEQLVGANRDFLMATARSYVAMAGGFDAGPPPQGPH